MRAMGHQPPFSRVLKRRIIAAAKRAMTQNGTALLHLYRQLAITTPYPSFDRNFKNNPEYLNDEDVDKLLEFASRASQRSKAESVQIFKRSQFGRDNLELWRHDYKLVPRTERRMESLTRKLVAAEANAERSYSLFRIPVPYLLPKRALNILITESLAGKTCTQGLRIDQIAEGVSAFERRRLAQLFNGAGPRSRWIVVPDSVNLLVATRSFPFQNFSHEDVVCYFENVLRAIVSADLRYIPVFIEDDGPGDLRDEDQVWEFTVVDEEFIHSSTVDRSWYLQPRDKRTTLPTSQKNLITTVLRLALDHPAIPISHECCVEYVESILECLRDPIPRSEGNQKAPQPLDEKPLNQLTPSERARANIKEYLASLEER